MKLKNLIGIVLGGIILSVTVAHAFYLENGNENYRNGQYDQAIQNYNAALSNGENSEKAYIGLARSYFKQNDFEKAFNIVDTALQTNPNSKNVLLLKARMYANFGNKNSNISQIDKSLDILNSLARIYPSDTTITSDLEELKHKKNSMQATLLAQDEDFQAFQPISRTNTNVSTIQTSKPNVEEISNPEIPVTETTNSTQNSQQLVQNSPTQVNYNNSVGQPQQVQYSQPQIAQAQPVQQPQQIQQQPINMPTQAAQPQSVQQQFYSPQIVRNDYMQKNNDYDNYVSTVPRPEWYEFCPFEYENPKHYKIYFTYSQVDSNYWYKRKQKFEEYLSTCDKKTGKYKDICYAKLRDSELAKSASYVPEKEKCFSNLGNYIQQQKEQKQLDAINNMADSIRNQNVNVKHSGTVNHNINGTMNYNINGNMNHYYRGLGW